MKELIDVWVCQNRPSRDEICISDRGEIRQMNNGWAGEGEFGRLDTQWIWINKDHPSYEMFYHATIFPNKVKAKMLIPRHWRDLENYKKDIKLI